MKARAILVVCQDPGEVALLFRLLQEVYQHSRHLVWSRGGVGGSSWTAVLWTRWCIAKTVSAISMSMLEATKFNSSGSRTPLSTVEGVYVVFPQKLRWRQ